MNNHDYHMISEESLRSSNNNHQEFIQSYLTSSAPNSNNVQDDTLPKPREIASDKSTVPRLMLKQSYANNATTNNMEVAGFTMKYRYEQTRVPDC